MMKTRWCLFIISIGLLILLIIYYLETTDTNRSKIASGIQTINRHVESFNTTTYYKGFQTSPPTTDISYEVVQSDINLSREQLAIAYKNTKNKNDRNLILGQAREQFVTSITTLLPYWYGTPWDFNGTSTTPQQGSIACGYYVTTVLKDNGLQVERNKLAQQASENIIKSLTSEQYIKRFSNTSLNEFIESIDSWGEGLYIVGLDFHVGYIWHDGTDIHFIHSTIAGPKSAFSEPAKSSNTLKNSKYRVIGKISDDDKLLLKWLQQTPIPTKT